DKRPPPICLVRLRRREGVAPLTSSPRRPTTPAQRSCASRVLGPARCARSDVRVAFGTCLLRQHFDPTRQPTHRRTCRSSRRLRRRRDLLLVLVALADQVVHEGL